MKQKVFLVLFPVMAALSLAAAPPLRAKTVVIDAGHGGIDRGGIPGQRYPEKVVAFDIAQRVNRNCGRRATAR